MLAFAVLAVTTAVGIGIAAAQQSGRTPEAAPLSVERPTTSFRESPVADVPLDRATSCADPTDPSSADRVCHVVVPEGLGPGERAPAVVLLHGLNTSPGELIQHGHWLDTARENRFVLVVPHGKFMSWNAGPCCGRASVDAVDDVGFLRGVVQRVRALDTVDPDRVVVVGESNGGMMAYAFACANADLIAGIASLEGTPLASCAPSRSLPLIHIHSRTDETVPYDGGVSPNPYLRQFVFAPVKTAVAQYAIGMGCAQTSTITSNGPIVMEDRVCPLGPVRLVSIGRQLHGWPPPEQFDATREIVRHLGIG